MSFIATLEIVAIVGSGLTAGIFYAFSTFVMAALKRLPPEQGIAAMNSINVTVVNPWFFAVFLGTPIVCTILAVMALIKGSAPDQAFVLAASLVHIVGSLGVTLAFNVPLNTALAAVNSADGEGAKLWARYLRTWTFWNHVRLAAALAGMVLFIQALMLAGRSA